MPIIFFHGEIHFLDYADEGQNLLGKGNNQSTEKAEEALRTLACIMALDGHTHLNNAPAKDDYTNGLDTGKDKV